MVLKLRMYLGGGISMVRAQQISLAKGGVSMVARRL